MLGYHVYLSSQSLNLINFRKHCHCWLNQCSMCYWLNYFFYCLQHQLQALMETLNLTEPHYIRCVKPNSLNRPQKFENLSILHQLRCGVSDIKAPLHLFALISSSNCCCWDVYSHLCYLHDIRCFLFQYVFTWSSCILSVSFTLSLFIWT